MNENYKVKLADTVMRCNKPSDFSCDHCKYKCNCKILVELKNPEAASVSFSYTSIPLEYTGTKGVCVKQAKNLKNNQYLQEITSPMKDGKPRKTTLSNFSSFVVRDIYETSKNIEEDIKLGKMLNYILCYDSFHENEPEEYKNCLAEVKENTTYCFFEQADRNFNYRACLAEFERMYGPPEAATAQKKENEKNFASARRRLRECFSKEADANQLAQALMKEIKNGTITLKAANIDVAKLESLLQESTGEHLNRNHEPKIKLNPNVVFLGVNAGFWENKINAVYHHFEMFNGNGQKANEMQKYLPVVEKLYDPNSARINLEGGYITDLFKFLPTQAEDPLIMVFNAIKKDTSFDAVKDSDQLAKFVANHFDANDKPDDAVLKRLYIATRGDVIFDNFDVDTKKAYLHMLIKENDYFFANQKKIVKDHLVAEFKPKTNQNETLTAEEKKELKDKKGVRISREDKRINLAVDAMNESDLAEATEKIFFYHMKSIPLKIEQIKIFEQELDMLGDDNKLIVLMGKQNNKCQKITENKNLVQPKGKFPVDHNEAFYFTDNNTDFKYDMLRKYLYFGKPVEYKTRKMKQLKFGMVTHYSAQGAHTKIIPEQLVAIATHKDFVEHLTH